MSLKNIFVKIMVSGAILREIFDKASPVDDRLGRHLAFNPKYVLTRTK
jgi:hypothetical protein